MRGALLQRSGASCLVLAAPGGTVLGVRFQRPGVAAAASRANWREEIESGSASTTSSTTSTTSSSSSGSSGTSSSSSTGLNTTIATSAVEAPQRPAAVNNSNSNAATSSGNDNGSFSPANFLAQLTARQQQNAADAGTSGGDGGAAREEPVSLPTFDLMEYLSDAKHQAGVFGTLAATSTVLALLCCIEPEAVLDLVVPKADTTDLDVTFIRIIGVTLAASASVEYSLKHAAESQLLKSPTYQRLMAGCALKSAGFLAVLLVNAPDTFGLWSSTAWMAYLLTAVGAASVNLAVISNTSGQGLALPPLDPSLPKNSTSWGYATCTALYLLTVLACFAPETIFTGDPYSAVTPLVKGVWAPGFTLAAVMSYVLKDAADRERLGASTFKNLNLGLAALEYGYAIIFGSAILSDQVDIDAASLSNLGGALAIATFCLYTYATAKK